MALVPTRKITALTPATDPLSGDEELECVQLGNSRKFQTRDLVLPTDSLITMSGMGGFLPGSRQLVSSPTINVSDGGPGGQVSLSTVFDGGALGLQTTATALGNNNNLIIGPAPVYIGFLDLNTAAGAADLTGLVAQFDGQIVTISNLGAALLRLMAQSASSAAANRFRLSANIGIVQNGSYTLRYSSALQRWVSLS